MKYTVWIETRKCGSRSELTFVIGDEEIKDLDEDEKKEYIESVAREILFDMIDWSYYENDPE